MTIAGKIAADIKALAVENMRTEFGQPEQISDPRDMRIRLRKVSFRGDRIDGKQYAANSISGPASAMARQIMIGAEVNGYSGEDLMTVLAFNALLQVERDFDRQLHMLAISPTPPIIMNPAGIAHSPAIGEFAQLEVGKLRERVKALESESKYRLSLLTECLEFIEEYEDVRDGSDGPLPNKAMSLCTAIKMALGELP